MSWISERHRAGRTPQGRYVVECDRCGFDFYKDSLRRQRGILVCHKCWDEKAVREVETFEGSVEPTSAPSTYRRVD